MSRATTPFTKRGWSRNPTGSVSIRRETATTSISGLCLQRLDGSEQRLLAVAEVGAEGDVDTGHRSSVSLPSRFSAAPPAHRASPRRSAHAALPRRQQAASRAIRCRPRSGGSRTSAPTSRRRRGRACRSRSSTAASTRRTPSSRRAPTRPSSTTRRSTAPASITAPRSHRSRWRPRTASASSASTRRRCFEAFDASPAGAITDFPASQGIAAAAQHCPGVISISFGGSGRDPALEQSILGAVHNGCLVVAAAGNGGLQGSPPTYPADYPHVLTVGATDRERCRRRLLEALARRSTSSRPASTWWLPSRSRTTRAASRRISRARASRPRSSPRRPPGCGRCDRRWM